MIEGDICVRIIRDGQLVAEVRKACIIRVYENDITIEIKSSRWTRG
jgi:hypothetical protein